MIGHIRHLGDPGEPYYDLLSDTISYSAFIEYANDYWKAYSLMKNAPKEEMKEVRREANPRVFFSKSGQQKIRENKVPYHHFVMRNFIQFFKVAPEHRHDIHRQTLQMNPDMRLMIYYQGPRGVLYDPENDGVVDLVEGSLLDLPTIIPTVQTFYDVQSGNEVTVRMVHYLKESMELRNRLQNSVNTRTSVDKYGAVLKSSIDYDDIVSCYEDSIIKVEGYCLEDSICTEENRSEWVDKIPFEHVMLVMDRVQSEVAEIL